MYLRGRRTDKERSKDQRMLGQGLMGQVERQGIARQRDSCGADHKQRKQNETRTDSEPTAPLIVGKYRQ